MNLAAVGFAVVDLVHLHTLSLICIGLITIDLLDLPAVGLRVSVQVWWLSDSGGSLDRVCHSF